MKTKFVCAAMLLVSLFAVGSASAQLSNGLEAYWKFNNNFQDSSGNGYDLTPSNSTVGFRPDGVSGQALNLTGDQTQYASRTVDDAAFNFGANDFTIQVWANFNAPQNGQGAVFLEKFDGANGPGWTLDILGGTTDTLEFFSDGQHLLEVSGINYTPDVWHQIIAERSGDTLSLFFDGTNIGSTAFTGSMNSTTNPLLIGRRNANDSRDFGINAGLDEIGIWNRGLSDAEIAALWNNGAGMDIAVVPEASNFALCGLAAAMLIIQIAASFTKRSESSPN